MHDLFTRHFGRDWTERLCDPDMWAQIENVDDQELWDVQRILKGRLVRFVRRKLTAQRRRWGASQDEIDRLQNVMDPEGLTIGFARRFATYKRAGLIMRDMDRLLDLVRSDHRPVQFVFAGKAHPADAPGQELIRQIAVLTHDPDICGRMVFLEDYDINVGRHLVQGVDVWLNNPRRPMEASGTSGMKVTPNGGLNLSVLDGWWPEGYDGKNGFAVESTSLGANLDEIDRRDSEQLLRVLQDEVVPLFYDRGGDNIPHGWMRRVKRAIRTLIWRFNTDRMVADYTRMCYLPCADALNADMQMT
jgi:starch phosphorylase